jgi:hypothetical protein
MGYIVHHAIVVTGWGVHGHEDYMQVIHAKCREYLAAGDNGLGTEGGFTTLLTPLASAMVNANYSFAILPDGSKDGWDTSDNMDKARDAIVDYLKSVNGKDGYVDWCEVQFGDEYHHDGMLRHSNEVDDEDD